jgi:hypothetical protein
MDKACSPHGGDEICVKAFCWKARREEDAREIEVAASIILKLILVKQSVRVWSGFIWHRLGAGVWLLITL